MLVHTEGSRAVGHHPKPHRCGLVLPRSAESPPPARVNPFIPGPLVATPKDRILLAFAGTKSDFSGIDTNAHASVPEDTQPELTPFDAPLHIAIAPSLLDVEHTVDREPGESDERYQSRCDMVAALLDYARKG